MLREGECKGMPGELTREDANCQGNAGEYRGMPGERTVVGAKCQGNAGECRGMPGKRIGVSVNCQVNAGNAGECQGKIWEWVYSATGMQGTTRVMQGSGCKVLAE